MTLSDLSIKNPVFAWMLMLGLIVFGWIGFQRMGVSQLPDVDFPIVTVRVTLEGASPEVMETQVADPIEDAVMSTEGIKEVSSSSRLGSTSIVIEFDLDRNIDLALQDVQSKIAQAQRNLPREIDPPVITKTNPEDNPIIRIAVSAEGRPLKEIMDYTNDFLKDQFTTVPGVGEVSLSGFIEPNLRVWLDENKMRDLEITVDDVMDAINTQHVEIPAGIIDTGKQELNVRVMGEAATVEQFRNIIIPKRKNGGRIWKTLRVKDVAEVEDGLNDVRRISRNKGVTAVGIGIKKQRGSNAVAVAQATKKRMEDIRKNLPPGFALTVAFDSTTFIEESTHELNFTLILAAVLTGLVCYLFLGSLSSTLNVLLAIPTSILGSFIVLYFMGFTLNTFTLLGLSLAIGIVVDDAIMVLENIVRHREEGESRVHAALLGAREITFAALAASVAILAIFLPVVFMEGIIGKFFFQFGVTMSAAVLLSLLEALTIAPMRCSQFLDVGHTGWVGRPVEFLMKKSIALYHRSLAWIFAGRALLRPVGVIVFSLVLLVGSWVVLKKVPREMVPAQDQSIFMVRVQTPMGTSLGATDQVMKGAEAWMAKQPEIKNYFMAVGGFGGGEVNTGILFVTMKPPKDRPVPPGRSKPYTQGDFIQIARKNLKDIPGVQRAIVQDLSLSSFSASRGFPIEFSLRGSDWDLLASLSEDLMKKMQDSGKMVDIDSDYRLGQPEVRVIPDREKAAARGVSVVSIGNTVNATIGGVRLGKYTRGGKRYDVRLRLVDKFRNRPESIEKLQLRNDQGELVPLSDVVRWETRSTLLSISRKNRERAISVFATMAPGVSQADALSVVQTLGQDLPKGYRLVLSGSAQTFKDSFKSLIIALVLGIFVAYMVLGAQFNSFVHPFTVLLALPFSVIGAFFALRLGGQSLNIYSLIGIILLMGIVKKNSILLVDFTNERRRKGEPLKEAILNACPLRLRPILMTSVATIAGAIPAALALGPGAETRVPMALVVIGGVFVSTLLTLFVVPCAYSLLSHIESHRHDQDLHEALVELGEVKD